MAKLACKGHFSEKTEEISVGVPGAKECFVCGKVIAQGPESLTLRDDVQPIPEAAGCAECGHPLSLSSGPGRTCEYRGVQGFTVPEHLTYEKCDHCGAKWMTDAQLDILGDSLEAQRLERQSREAKSSGQE